MLSGYSSLRETRQRVETVPRKCVVKVILSRQQREILCELASRLGTSESETLRTALMDYAKDLSLIREKIHRGSEPKENDA